MDKDTENRDTDLYKNELSRYYLYIYIKTRRSVTVEMLKIVNKLSSAKRILLILNVWCHILMWKEENILENPDDEERLR